MKYIIVGLLFFQFNLIFAQNESSLKGQGSESKGICKGEWKLFYETGEVFATGKYKNNFKTGPWKYFTKEGKIKASGNFLDNKKEGTWLEISLNGDSLLGTYTQDYKSGKWTKIEHGHILEEANFDMNQLHGKYKKFYHSGNLQIEANYIKDSLSGIYKKYYESGKIAIFQQFSDNKRNGDYIALYENGDTIFSINYKNNLKSGIYKSFYKNKKLKETGVYQDDIKTGIWKMFDDKGNLILLVNAENGFPNRTYKLYQKGSLLVEGEFLNDKPYSAFKKYHSNGKLLLLGYYNSDGNLEDTLEEYFSDGNLNKIITFQNGTKTGDYKEYHANGSILKHYKFEHDEIQEIVYFGTLSGKPSSCYYTKDDSSEVYFQVDSKGKITKGTRPISNPINHVNFEDEYLKNDGIIKSLENELILEIETIEAFK